MVFSGKIGMVGKTLSIVTIIALAGVVGGIHPPAADGTAHEKQ